MAIPSSQRLPSANYSWERKLADSNKLRQQNLANFQSASQSPESFSRYVEEQERLNKSEQTVPQGGFVRAIPGDTFSNSQRNKGQTTQPTAGKVQESFNRMMNIGEVGGLGGRMGELEKASMRLAEAASQRKRGEMANESELRGGLLEKEIAAKTAGISSEARASEKAGLESRMRSLQAKGGTLSWQEMDELNQLRRQIGMLG